MTVRLTPVPDFAFERSALESRPIGTRTTISSALVLFAPSQSHVFIYQGF